MKIGKLKFPSPFRVSFLLMFVSLIIKILEYKRFRLLSEYHFFLHSKGSLFQTDYLKVSVSFQSIISSYAFEIYLLYDLYFVSVSFQSIISSYFSPALFFTIILLVSVSFQSIISSYLPQQTPYFIIYYFIIFVRILKIFIFLFLNNKKYTLPPIFKVSWRLLKKIIIFVFNFI